MKCVCCGENDINCLTIDHINNNGAEHRNKNHIDFIAQWLIKNNFPTGFQTLCINCNCVKEWVGGCDYRKGKYLYS